MSDIEPGKVVVVGQGYVGLPLALAAVQAGHVVVGVDSNSHRVKLIMSGLSPVENPDSAEIMSALRESRYSATTDYRKARGFLVAIITVPTPLSGGKPDLSFIESAATALAPHISMGATVILESTSYPGTTEELLIPLLEKNSGLTAGVDFNVGYSPERIDPGNEKWNLVNTPKVVSGIDARSLEKTDAFYRGLGIPTVPVSGTREAELAKLLENTFRHVNIALVNELAMFSSSLSVDIWEAIEAASTKPFGYMKFTPGPGVGGHCLPVDPSYLSWAIQDRTGQDFKFVELANTVNSSMPRFVLDKALQLLALQGLSPQDTPVLIVGLAYKPDTSDIRESPALRVAELLLECGANVFAIDAHVADWDWPPKITRVHENEERQFPLGLLLTDHSDKHGHKVLNGCLDILDTQRAMFGASVTHL